ncbi:hypothetical protein EDEG_02560 [Edhazardia aedis USNM 41457]|uniref:ABC transporter domain-containing protein n=1 Tax=Edhazardia aedis (strain USNM 41457) TaxID=1003232 RepID=J8ZTU2_EDHAE|nr:hypothetical protein EDEG_02560 [Edhazardia aedis USNM 41457]|eukprot:EJW03058.1 hypothetical protein EDEG_02560 [Edhazardia aedis USNM 41457]
MEVVFNNITVKVKTTNGWITILNNVCGKISKRSMVGVFGESGSGKTTLMHILTGIVRSSGKYIIEGEITVDGKPRDPEIWLKKIGFVRQEDLFNQEETIYECIENCARFFYQRSDKAFIDPICQKYLQLVNISDVKNTKIKEISGGQKKRLSIACVLLKEPDIVFLDEPFSGLDSNNIINIGNFLKHDSEKNGTSYVVIAHTVPSYVMALFEYVICLNKGDPVYIGNIKDLEAIFQSAGVEIPKNAPVVELLLQMTDTKFSYMQKTDFSKATSYLKKYYVDSTSSIGSGKGKFIRAKRIFFCKPSFSQVFTMIRRRFNLTFCKGLKRILWKLLSFIPIITALAVTIIAKFSVDVELEKNTESNQKIDLEKLQLICAIVFSFSSYSILCGMLLGQLWGIMKNEKKIAQDELDTGKYNLVTYILYVIIYSYVYTILISILVVLPMLLCFFNFIQSLKIVWTFIWKVSPIALLLFWGISSIFHMSILFSIIKFILQISFLFILFFSEVLKPSKVDDKWYMKLINLWPSLCVSLYLDVYSFEIFRFGVSDALIQYTEDENQTDVNFFDNAKKLIMNDLLSTDKFYFIFSAIVVVLLIAGAATQYTFRVPKYTL